ncbi:probable Mitochondria fission 1 protein [Saccharomycodes ludwigii]|uniref:Mitochondrial fission 1 protein n=1 Tax=Saccharomycodes ludwigii TaxID=36035 RepID=A0A376B584_9ASCO|nr:hypothetical protein SCDLUD_000333 [Saccharomycodes ludwigii]KAH3902745.1 hypothetical protein SCDLUD_000333 [Saccharomycodes ludwigii]SSD59813.1 probable Mitochondria fission 1 protein [Saccharomycodes ludwigii]
MSERLAYLPTLEDAYGELPPAQLEILRQQVLSEGGDIASIQSRFNYAWGLIKSNDVDNQRLGVKLLSDVYKEAPKRRRECLYYLTIGCYKMGEYTMAKRYIDALAERESSHNTQVFALKKMVESKIASQSLKGLALVSVVIGAAAYGINVYMRGSKKR